MRLRLNVGSVADTNAAAACGVSEHRVARVLGSARECVFVRAWFVDALLAAYALFSFEFGKCVGMHFRIRNLARWRL